MSNFKSLSNVNNFKKQIAALESSSDAEAYVRNQCIGYATECPLWVLKRVATEFLECRLEELKQEGIGN